MDNKSNSTFHLSLRGNVFMKLSGFENIHQFSLKSNVSALTAYKYAKMPNPVKAVDLKVLTSLLMDGCGMTQKQVLEMKIGDLFEFIQE